MVIFIFHQNNLSRIIVLFDLVRAGTDQVGSKSPVLTSCGACILREDICVRSTDILYKRSKWILQGDIEMIIVHDLKTRKLCCASSQHILCTLDHIEVCGALCCGRRGKHTLKRKFYVLAGQLGAVGEVYTLL